MKKKPPTFHKAVRFDEVYWAPLMADAKSPVGVARWVFAQAFRPWKTLPSPWRERQRLRRATLVSLFARQRYAPRRTPLDPAQADADCRDYHLLMSAYHDFEGLQAHEDHPEGSFDQFLAFLATAWPKEPADAVHRRQQIARAWRRAYVLDELRNAFVLATVGLVLVLLLGASLAEIIGVVQALLNWAPLSHAVRTLDLPFKADLKTVVTIGGALVRLLGVGKFLTD